MLCIRTKSEDIIKLFLFLLFAKCYFGFLQTRLVVYKQFISEMVTSSLKFVTLKCVTFSSKMHGGADRPPLFWFFLFT